jgi:hypothetical protein
MKLFHCIYFQFKKDIYTLISKLLLDNFFSTIHAKDKVLMVEVWDWDAVGKGTSLLLSLSSFLLLRPPLLLSSNSCFFVDDFLGQVQISVDELQDSLFEVQQYKLAGKKENTLERGSVSFSSLLLSPPFSCPSLFLSLRKCTFKMQGCDTTSSRKTWWPTGIK